VNAGDRIAIAVTARPGAGCTIEVARHTNESPVSRSTFNEWPSRDRVQAVTFRLRDKRNGPAAGTPIR